MLLLLLMVLVMLLVVTPPRCFFLRLRSPRAKLPIFPAREVVARSAGAFDPPHHPLVASIQRPFKSRLRLLQVLLQIGRTEQESKTIQLVNSLNQEREREREL